MSLSFNTSLHVCCSNVTISYKSLMSMFQGHIGRQTVTLTWAWLTIHNSGY